MRITNKKNLPPSIRERKPMCDRPQSASIDITKVQRGWQLEQLFPSDMNASCIVELLGAKINDILSAASANYRIDIKCQRSFRRSQNRLIIHLQEKESEPCK